MAKISGYRASIGIQLALAAAGLGRTSSLAGGETAGWIERNRFGSTGFSLRERADGGVDWHIVLSGRPHLKYREYTQDEDGERVSLHEPINAQKLNPAIKAVFESLGMDVIEVTQNGYQTMWDDDVQYDIATRHPDWLDKPDTSNRRGNDSPTKPTLVAVKFEGDLGCSKVLPAYQQGEAFLITRRTLDVLMAEKDWNDKPRNAIEMTADGTIAFPQRVYVRSRQVQTGSRRIVPETVVDPWGGSEQAWKIPGILVRSLPIFRSDIPVSIGGVEFDNVPPAFIDRQYGEAPWNKDAHLPAAPAGPSL